MKQWLQKIKIKDISSELKGLRFSLHEFILGFIVGVVLSWVI